MIRFALALLGASLIAVVAVLVFDNGYAGPQCVVSLLMRPSPPQPRIRGYVRRLRTDRDVARVVVVSPAKAFKLLKKQYPALMQQLPSNPLPWRIDVYLNRSVSPVSFAGRYESLHLKDVDQVQLRGLRGGFCLSAQ